MNETETNQYSVEVYHCGNIIAVLTVTATDEADASNEAFKQFFASINCKVKKHYG